MKFVHKTLNRNVGCSQWKCRKYPTLVCEQADLKVRKQLEMNDFLEILQNRRV